MAQPRKRPLFKRIVLTMTVSVLLLAAYLSAYSGWCFGVGAGMMPLWANRPAQVIFAPIDLYCRYRGPGSDQVEAMVTWSLNEGWRSRGYNPDGSPIAE